MKDTKSKKKKKNSIFRYDNYFLHFIAETFSRATAVILILKFYMIIIGSIKFDHWTNNESKGYFKIQSN